MSVSYWFVGSDGEEPWGFHCDEGKLTEAEWRRRAPVEQVAELDDSRRGTSGLFPRDIAASSADS